MQINAGWRSGNKLRYVTVQPNLVAEVRADTAVQQLAGYLLLDYDDVYGIDRVGLYLAVRAP